MAWNLSQGYSAGGSENSGWSASSSNSWSQSGTDALSARDWSALQATIAWNRDMEAMQQQMEFNAAEAQKQREWQEQMANTVYTRSVKNMREAGINPILAANMGLSGASVGSGATASLGGAPSAPLAQSFMDSWSASNAISQGNSEYGGSSWNNSENGLVTALSALGNVIGNALSMVTSGSNINLTLDLLKDEQARQEQRKRTNEAVQKNNYSSKDYPHNPGSGRATEESVQATKNIIDKVTGWVKNLF